MSQPEANPVHVSLINGGLEARMRLQPGLGALDRTLEGVRANLLAAGVSARWLDEPAIRDALDRYDPANGLEGVVVARGEPPKPATAGAFQLIDTLRERLEIAERRADTQAQAPSAAAVIGDALAAADDAVSHYERSAFVIVQAGEPLGRMIPSDPGMDGEDVSGRSIAAPASGEPEFKPGDSIEVRRDGAIHAAVSGRLVADGHVLEVSHTLELDGAVDFSTGNIRFPGDVSVSRDIGDRFEVECDGDLVVGDVVQAAYVRVGGSAHIRLGMTGRGRGVLRVRRDLEARYLDDAQITVGGELRVDREITAAQLTVLGEANCPSCNLIGGVATLARAAHFATLGAPGATPTRVALGQREDLESVLVETAEMLTELERVARVALDRLNTLQALGSRMSHAEAERMTEAQFEAADAENKRDRLLEAIR
ncbi:MAG: FapA family protein, partial [Planctomycetota bacterium]